MPHLYRALPVAYVEDYSGLGGSYKNGARWNRIGQPVLYFATNPSLARLEMANYIPSPRLVPARYVLAQYWLDDAASIEDMNHPLPSDWDAFPYPGSTQTIGGNWLASRRTLGLLVPSVADPMKVDHCMVVNPLHPDISMLKYMKHTAALYNARAFTAS